MASIFSDTLYGEMASLRLYAGIHPKRYGFHMMLSRVFPYSVYYDIEGGVAKVYAVIDNRRNPDWVRMRISNAFGIRKIGRNLCGYDAAIWNCRFMIAATPQLRFAQ